MADILYITSGLKGEVGALRCAYDSLINLLTYKFNVTVIAPGKSKLPDKVNNITLNVPKWINTLNYSRNEKIYEIKKPKETLYTMQFDISKSLKMNKIKKLNPDFIFVHSVSGYFFYKHLEIKSNAKKIMIVQESPRHYPENSLIKLDEVIESMNECYGFIFASKNCMNEWSKIIGDNNKPKYYVPNCANEEEINKLIKQDKEIIRKKVGFPDNQFAITCVASIQPRKGQDIILNNLHEMVYHIPNLKVYLLGSNKFDKKWENSLLKRVKNKHNLNYIEYLGFKENALEYIYASDLFILPSRAEAMPLSIIEAMALKTPIFCSDVDGNKELINDKINGILFTHEKESSFIEKFKYLSENLEKTSSYSEISYKKYWEQFSKERQVAKYHEILNDLANRNGLI